MTLKGLDKAPTTIVRRAGAPCSSCRGVHDVEALVLVPFATQTSYAFSGALERI